LKQRKKKNKKKKKKKKKNRKMPSWGTAQRGIDSVFFLVLADVGLFVVLISTQFDAACRLRRIFYSG